MVKLRVNYCELREAKSRVRAQRWTCKQCDIEAEKLTPPRTQFEG